MLNEATLDKLAALKLTGMAAAYERQLEEPEVRGLSFEERFRDAGRQPLDVA